MTIAMTRTLGLTGLVTVLLQGCATMPEAGVKRDRIRDCPPGQVLICESRQPREPSRGGDEEIPEYDYCRCEDVM